jgi:Outer membrane protein beta-barrel domain
MFLRRAGNNRRYDLPNTKIILQTGLLLLVSAAFHAALAGPVEVQSIQIAPAETKVGIYPEITGSINMNKVNVPGETLEIIVIAVVFRPDHVMKSWTWKNVNMKDGEVKQFTIPKEYRINLAGSYKVDFNVYTKDMKPLHRLSKSFVVIDPSLPLSKTITPKKDMAGTTALSSGQASARSAEYQHIGVGLYANTLNPSGGATVLLWPLKYVGIQGSYTVGSFTTAEGRLLARFPLSSGINPYAGIGYLSVSTERTVDAIGVKSKFKDSGVSGVIGVEIPLNKSIYGYVELSGAKIDLEQNVTSGVLTGTATVKYTPVTVGLGIVYYFF